MILGKKKQHICERSCFSTVALLVVLASLQLLSYNQFCRSCKYYDFETVQHCHGTTTDSPETGASGEALYEN